MKTKLQIGILGRVWTVKFLTDKQYCKLVGTDSRAVCDTENKTVYFNLQFFDDVTVRHEITHAYASETSFVVLQLNEEQWEEWACELFGKYGPEMLAISEYILAHGACLLKKKNRG